VAVGVRTPSLAIQGADQRRQRPALDSPARTGYSL